MYKIYLDASKRYEKKVSLIEITDGKEKVLGEKFGDIDLVVSIQELLKKHGLEISDIDEAIPNLGPGSFTGLKVGVTITNIINWVNGKKKPHEIDLPEYGRAPNITPPKNKGYKIHS